MFLRTRYLRDQYDAPPPSVHSSFTLATAVLVCVGHPSTYNLILFSSSVLVVSPRFTDNNPYNKRLAKRNCSRGVHSFHPLFLDENAAYRKSIRRCFFLSRIGARKRKNTAWVPHGRPRCLLPLSFFPRPFDAQSTELLSLSSSMNPRCRD